MMRAQARLVPSGGTVRGRVRLPPSKSVTHRYLNLTLLAGAPVELVRPLDAEDTRLFFAVLEALGFGVARRGDAVRLVPGRPPAEATLHCGNAGTLFRFLVASLATLPGRWTVDGTPRLRQRPVGPLVVALRRLGAQVEHLGQEGYAPLRVTGGSLPGGATRLDAGESSQYLSALLMAGLRAAGEVEVEVEALTSGPYVAVTLDAAGTFGGRIQEVSPGRYRVRPGLAAPPRLEVEGDYSAACYPAAAAALTGGRVHLAGLRPDSPQGDRRFLDLLESLGARVEEAADGWIVTGGGELRAVEADLSSMPDQVPTLAALAPFAHGVTRITNVAHLRIKESDRLAAVAAELSRAGAVVEELPDGLEVPGVWAAAPPPATAVTVASHGDHRIAMSLALVGLRRPGLRVAAPQVVGKSYPAFWDDLEALLA